MFKNKLFQVLVLVSLVFGLGGGKVFAQPASNPCLDTPNGTQTTITINNKSVSVTCCNNQPQPGECCINPNTCNSCYWCENRSGKYTCVSAIFQGACTDDSQCTGGKKCKLLRYGLNPAACSCQS